MGIAAQGTSTKAHSEKGARPEKGQGFGFARLFFDLRHRRYRFRQFVGVLLVFVLTGLGRPHEPLLSIGAVTAVVGMLIRLWAAGCVKKNKVLATGGPYAWVRHPLYTGNLLICIGFVLAAGVWWGAVLAVAIWWLFYPSAIQHEDGKLHRLFGETWETWSARTPALIPRPPSEKPEPVEWSGRQCLMANGEPIYALVMSLCLVYLYTRVG